MVRTYECSLICLITKRLCLCKTILLKVSKSSNGEGRTLPICDWFMESLSTYGISIHAEICKTPTLCAHSHQILSGCQFSYFNLLKYWILLLCFPECVCDGFRRLLRLRPCPRIFENCTFAVDCYFFLICRICNFRLNIHIVNQSVWLKQMCLSVCPYAKIGLRIT